MIAVRALAPSRAMPHSRGGVLLLACSLLPATTTGLRATEEVESTTRRILTAFDAAWAAGDLDSMMSPFSPKFGCALYGGLDREVLHHAFDTLHTEVLPDTRCHTRVLAFQFLEPTAQALVTREFHAADGALREQQWHTFYLRRPAREIAKDTKDAATSHPLEIVALEEFDPAALDQIRDDHYLGRASGLRLELPRDLFVVLPPCSSSIDRITLRTPDLEDEIRITVKCFSDPFDLEHRLDEDLENWRAGRVDADIRLRRASKILGRPAVRVDVTYRGPTCQLDPHGRDDLRERTLIRVYVALDSEVLLAVDLDAGSERVTPLTQRFDALIAGLRIDEPGAKKPAAITAGYGRRLLQRIGLGPLPEGRFTDPTTQIEIEAPSGYSLRRVPCDAAFALEARPLDPSRASAFTIRIEAIEPADPRLDLESFVTYEDLGFADLCDELGHRRPTIQYTAMQKGDLSVLQVERKLEVDPDGADRIQLARYLRVRERILVIETSVTPAERAEALRGLDSVCSRLRLR